MYLVFYKFWHGGIKDWIIALLTWSIYSHVELTIKKPRHEGDLIKFTGVSSSPREGGVRQKEISSKSKKWEVVNITHKLYRDSIEIYEMERIIPLALRNIEYDWQAIFCGWLGFKGYNKYTCSDFICAILYMGNEEYSTPGSLFRMVKFEEKHYAKRGEI